LIVSFSALIIISALFFLFMIKEEDGVIIWREGFIFINDKTVGW